MSLRAWIQAEGARSQESEDPDEEVFCNAALTALGAIDDVSGLSPEVVDRALWNISRQLDWSLWQRNVGESKRIAIVEMLPDMLSHLEAAGFADVTAFSYFWSGFTHIPDSAPPAIRDAILQALRRQATTGPNALDAVLQGLEEMHGTPGAATLASDLLLRSELGADTRTFLEGLLSELTLMEERMARQRGNPSSPADEAELTPDS